MLTRRQFTWGAGAVVICAVLAAVWSSSRYRNRVEAAVSAEILALDARLEMLRAVDRAQNADALGAWFSQRLDVRMAEDSLREASKALAGIRAGTRGRIEKYESRIQGYERIESERQGDMVSAVQLANRMAGAPTEMQVAVENEIQLSGVEVGLVRRWAKENASKMEQDRAEVARAEEVALRARERLAATREASAMWESVSEEVERRERAASDRAESARDKVQDVLRLAKAEEGSPNVKNRTAFVASTTLREALLGKRQAIAQFKTTAQIDEALDRSASPTSWTNYWTKKRLAKLWLPGSLRSVVEETQGAFSQGAPAELAEDRARKWEAAAKAAEVWQRAERTSAQMWARAGQERPLGP